MKKVKILTISIIILFVIGCSKTNLIIPISYNGYYVSNYQESEYYLHIYGDSLTLIRITIGNINRIKMYIFFIN